MVERAPLDRRSLQHTSKEPEAQVWAQIGTPHYNPSVPQASDAKETSPPARETTLESSKNPKLGSPPAKTEDTVRIASTSVGGDSRDDESDVELHVDENAETNLVEADPEPKESEGDDKGASKGEGEKSDKDEKEDKESSGDDELPFTSSNDPKLIKARVFIGQLDTSNCTKKDVEKVFAPYGKMLGVLLLHGYGFVQYEDEESAKNAIKEAHGTPIGGAKIICDRPMALKQLLRDERRRGSGSPDSMRRRERELLEELDYLRRREHEHFSRLEELDRYHYHDRFSDRTRPPYRDPYFDHPFERSLPPPPMDRYERMRMEELERSRDRDRYLPARHGLYDRPRDDPFDDRRPFHRDPFDRFDGPPPHRRY